MISPWLIVTTFILSWLFTISGVALGGWLVFKTKREGFENNLFQVKGPEGKAFNVEDSFNFTDSAPSSTGLPASVLDASDRFTQQFAETLANKVAK